MTFADWRIWWRNRPRRQPVADPFMEMICGCGHRAADHEASGWGGCKKCPCTDGDGYGLNK